MRLVIVALCASAVTAEANAGRGMDEGTHTSEVSGLRAVAIEHEDLRFDLRPLAGGDGMARISATYQLDNRSGTTITEPLVFVSGTGLGNLDIAFAGGMQTSTQLTPAQLAALPAAWRSPMTTPGFDGEPLGYATEDTSALAFTLAIPPGKHPLVITYVARPEWIKSRSSATMLHQLGYKLVPARDWGSFGTLDVTVEVPPGWEAAVSPPLAREGDTLHRRFPSLPADAIGITVRAPTSRLHVVLQYTLPLVLLFVLVGGVFLLRAIGRSRTTEDLRPLWPRSLPVAFVWAVGIAVAGGYVALRSTLALPADESGARAFSGLGGLALAVFGAILAVPVGMWIASVSKRHQ